MPATNLTLSVILTALNEENNIVFALTDILGAFDEFGIKGEIVAVDDGSTDKTGKLIDQISLKDSRVRKLRHEHPFGVGGAFWDGVRAARNDIAIWFPADNENDPREIFRYYYLLEHVDMVLPFIFNNEVRPKFRNVVSFIYRLIINTTFVTTFNYTNGTVLYRRSVLRQLEYHSTGFFFQTDILIRLVKKGYLFTEVPCRLSRRTQGISKAISFPSLCQVIQCYLRLVRDCYFRKDKTAEPVFVEGSITAIRRKNK